MKKYLIRVIALLIFASVSLTSCSVEYREHRRAMHDHDHDHDHDDHHDDHNYHN